MDIEGLGVRQIVVLLEQRADQRRRGPVRIRRACSEELVAIDRMGEKSVENLIAAIDASKEAAPGAGAHRPRHRPRRNRGGRGAVTPLPHHRRHHGRARGRPVGRCRPSAPRSPPASPPTSPTNPTGPSCKELRCKLAFGWPTRSGPSPASSPSPGLRFVVTGRLANFSRSQAQGRVKDAGGAVSGSVSKRTDYLVAGEDAGSKLADAEKLGMTHHRRGPVRGHAGARPARSAVGIVRAEQPLRRPLLKRVAQDRSP